MIALLLAACGGPNMDTLVDELRVVSVIAEPPEVAPGAEVTLTPVVADPAETSAEVLVWTCTDAGDGCVEAALPTAAWTRVLDLGAAATFTAPALTDLPASGIPIPVWVLACEPGLCPVIADVRAAEGGVASRRLARDLADPQRWLVDLPFRGVSLASKLVWVSERAEPNQNPLVVPRFDAVDSVVDGTSRLSFDVRDDAPADARSWAWSTAGGFEGTDRDASSGRVRWTWFAPDTPGPVELFVAVDDGEGGTAMWRDTVTVR